MAEFIPTADLIPNAIVEIQRLIQLLHAQPIELRGLEEILLPESPSVGDFSPQALDLLSGSGSGHLELCLVISFSLESHFELNPQCLLLGSSSGTLGNDLAPQRLLQSLRRLLRLGPNVLQLLELCGQLGVVPHRLEEELAVVVRLPLGSGPQRFLEVAEGRDSSRARLLHRSPLGRRDLRNIKVLRRVRTPVSRWDGRRRGSVLLRGRGSLVPGGRGLILLLLPFLPTGLLLGRDRSPPLLHCLLGAHGFPLGFFYELQHFGLPHAFVCKGNNKESVSSGKTQSRVYKGGDEPRDREPEAHLYLVHVECVEARRRAMSPLVGMGKNHFEFNHGTPLLLNYGYVRQFHVRGFLLPPMGRSGVPQAREARARSPWEWEGCSLLMRHPRSWPFAGILSMARKQCHTDHGFLPKAQPDLDLAVHVSLYRWSKSSLTRILVFLRTRDVTSGPELIQAYSYTSIIHLGLAVGDTPDAPCYHLGPEDQAVRHEPNPCHQDRELPEDIRH
ncbi:hypothetical protein F511_07546 [Dorcoceras hygrometricum]|uniref:Uncharacterized protein n=1 Tax=Dorcoceras hygrometricum TaxID=472368 RepID=A0A2Z7AXF8_9LAMI|nr:hypothetical protein F511_07546 [Dorcoceras hygrometricum]